MTAYGIDRTNAAGRMGAAPSAADLWFTPDGDDAEVRTVQAKLREIEVTPQDYGADDTGVSSCVTAFQAAMTVLANGGKLRVPEGTYLFTLASDSDSIQIPSGVSVECDAGVVFKYSYNNAPLFVISEKSNVRIVGRPKIVFTGTYNTDASASSSPRFGYTYSTGAYQWRVHIACVGSSNVEIDVICEGNTTANVQDAAILLLGADDGSLTAGNRVTVLANDVAQGVVMSAQKGAVIDVTTDRYSQASNAVYGPGHAVYHINKSGDTASTGCKIRIVDTAGTAISSYTSGGHTGAFRNINNSEIEINSQRAEGAFYYDKVSGCRFKVLYRSSSTEDDTSNYTIMGIDTNGGSADISIDAQIYHLGQRNQGLIGSSITPGSDCSRMRVKGMLVRNCDGSESIPSLGWAGEYGESDITYINIGSGAQRTLAVNILGDNNIHRVKSLGVVANPRISVTAGSNNTFYCSGDSTVDYDGNEFTPASGNAVIWESARQYQSNKSIGTTTNPTTTFQLPKDGAYIVSLTLIESALDHARTSMWWVVWDNDTNDFTVATEMVTAATKGASAPSAMALTVDNAGLCTVTSTAGSATWSLRYGYRQISGT